MKAVKLAGLEPAEVFGYFEKLCSMPHGSGNTKMISDYLVSFAREHGLRYIQDDLHNVILFADGTPGYENHLPVILQGHMDMVCEKDADCTIDMTKEGVDVTHDGAYVFARGTTLGADDGIALAYGLALLASKDIPHPPLEVVFTVDEETGMNGAASIDLSSLRGRRLINIDAGGEGVFTASCAGGICTTITMPVERRAVYGPCVRLTVEGLRGGHSGLEIHESRANAIKVMGELLSRVEKLMPLCLTKLTGGAKHNVIPNSCQVTLVAMGIHLERINAIAQQLEQEIRQRYDEPDVKIYGDDVDALGGNALTTADTSKVIALLCAAPHGVQGWSEDIPGLVQTSLNLAVVTLGKELQMVFSIRSSVNQQMYDLAARLEELARFYDAKAEHTGQYLAWEYQKDSILRETMQSVYYAMTGKFPKVVALHAGLECGLFCEKLPDLDCVAIGPNNYDVHTSKERLEIGSTLRTWAFLKEVLKAL